jgi:hypothetical protein
MERPAFVYLESADHPQAEEILVKSSRLFGITAAISIVVQPLDHPTLPSLQLIDTASLSFECSRNSRPEPVIGARTPAFLLARDQWFESMSLQRRVSATVAAHAENYGL